MDDLAVADDYVGGLPDLGLAYICQRDVGRASVSAIDGPLGLPFRMSVLPRQSI